MSGCYGSKLDKITRVFYGIFWFMCCLIYTFIANAFIAHTSDSSCLFHLWKGKDGESNALLTDILVHIFNAFDFKKNKN